MTITPFSFSSYATYSANVSGFRTLQQQLAQLQNQLATQRKSQDLSFYGLDAKRLLESRADDATRSSYLQTIASLGTEVKSYDRIFTHLEKIASDAIANFTSPLAQAPQFERHTLTFAGDPGDTGDTYSVTVNGQTFSYRTNGTERTLDEIAGNLAQQINRANITVTAQLLSGQLILTGRIAGQSSQITARAANVAGGTANDLTIQVTQAAQKSGISDQLHASLRQVQSLLNETLNGKFLFGGIGTETAPVVDLTSLPPISAPGLLVAPIELQQLAPGTLSQQVRITTNPLGFGQSETFTVNASTVTLTGPRSAQEVALAGATALNTALGGAVTIGDIDAQGFTLTASPGTGFTLAIGGTSPVPSTAATVQSNVPVGPQQRTQFILPPLEGTIGQEYQLTLSEPANPTPETFSYRTTGGEQSLSDVVDALLSQVNAHVPSFTLTASDLGGGKIQISSPQPFTARASLGPTAQASTIQRTIVPAAQQDTIRFPGPFGDGGETYGVNFTSPVAVNLTVTTTALDDAATIADQFAQQINANPSLGVTAAVRGGDLVATATQPGTGFTLALAPYTDTNSAIQSQPPILTHTVANIAPGIIPQTDRVTFSNPAGQAGLTYTVTIDGRPLSYTTDGQERDADSLAIQIAALINAAQPPFPVSATPGTTGSGSLDVTALQAGVAHITAVTTTSSFLAAAGAPTTYDAARDSVSLANLDRVSTTAIADGLTITHGFTANDPAFQHLIAALRVGAQAGQDPTHYQALLDQARGLVTSALSELRQLHVRNSTNDALLSATTLSHQTSINLDRSAVDAIETIDPAEVATKIQAAQIQLQALFSTTASTGRLSLVNFLT
jgi:phage tail sheath gpL-like